MLSVENQGSSQTWPLEPSPNPLRPPDQTVDNVSNRANYSETGEPPIVNRDAQNLSKKPLPFNLSNLFGKIQAALAKTGQGIRLNNQQYYETVANEIFAEEIEELEFLHATSLDSIRSEFNKQFRQFGINFRLQQQIDSVLSALFLVSIFNSSIRESAENLNRSIETYLPQTTFSHFQQIILDAEEALRQASFSLNKAQSIQILTDARAKIKSLLDLYEYEDGREAQLMQRLIFECYIDMNSEFFRFPNARAHYQQFSSALKQRKKDSPLNDLKSRVHSQLAQLITNDSISAPLSPRERFCDIESETIWDTGIEILKMAYEKRYFYKKVPSDSTAYEKWSRYCGNLSIDPKEFMEKFIKQLNETDFQTLSTNIKNLHSIEKEKTEELKEARKKVLLNLFVSKFPGSITFNHLKKWYQK